MPRLHLFVQWSNVSSKSWNILPFKIAVLNWTNDFSLIKEGESFPNILKPCEQCQCLSGNVICSSNCFETQETCARYSSFDYIFKWIAPGPSECCGKCEKQISKSLVFELFLSWFIRSNYKYYKETMFVNCKAWRPLLFVMTIVCPRQYNQERDVRARAMRTAHNRFNSATFWFETKIALVVWNTRLILKPFKWCAAMTRSSRPNTSAFWIALVPIADRKRRLGPCPIFRVYLQVFGKLFFKIF